MDLEMHDVPLVVRSTCLPSGYTYIHAFVILQTIINDVPEQ